MTHYEEIMKLPQSLSESQEDILVNFMSHLELDQKKNKIEFMLLQDAARDTMDEEEEDRPKLDKKGDTGNEGADGGANDEKDWRVVGRKKRKVELPSAIKMYYEMY